MINISDAYTKKYFKIIDSVISGTTTIPIEIGNQKVITRPSIQPRVVHVKRGPPNHEWTNSSTTVYDNYSGTYLGTAEIGTLQLTTQRTEHSFQYNPGLLGFRKQVTMNVEIIKTYDRQLKTEDLQTYTDIGITFSCDDKDVERNLNSYIKEDVKSIILNSITKYVNTTSNLEGGSYSNFKKTNRRVKINNQVRVVYVNKYKTEYVKYKGGFKTVKKALKMAAK